MEEKGKKYRKGNHVGSKLPRNPQVAYHTREWSSLLRLSFFFVKNTEPKWIHIVIIGMHSCCTEQAGCWYETDPCGRHINMSMNKALNSNLYRSWILLVRLWNLRSFHHTGKVSQPPSLPTVLPAPLYLFQTSGSAAPAASANPQ